MNSANTAETTRWLNTRMHNGRRRVETLGWKRLAAIHRAAGPAAPSAG